MFGSFSGTSDSLVQRMIRAARLEPDLYEEVEADQTATPQAALAVAVVAGATALGAALLAAVQGGSPTAGLLRGIAIALIGWVAWSYTTYIVGTRLFDGTATPGQMLRTIGFAQSPGVLMVFVFVPLIGWLMMLAAMAWSIVAAVVAVRQALDFDTGRAVTTVMVSFIPYLLVVALASVLIRA